MAGPEFLIASAAMQVFQGFQAYQQGREQVKAAQQTAAYNAQVEAQSSAVEKMRLERQQKLFASTQRAKAAGSGATLGSFEDTFEDTVTQSLLDVALLDYNTKLKQQQIRYQGDVESSQAKSQGTQGLISGLTGAASTGYMAYQGYNAPKAPSGSEYKTGSGGYNPSKYTPPKKPIRYS